MKRTLTLVGMVALFVAALSASACAPSTPAPTAVPAPTTAPAVAPTVAAPTAAPTTAAPAAAPTTAAAPAGDVAAGKTVFDQFCNSCHPNGQAGAGPALAGKNLQGSQIQSKVRSGGGGMPAFTSAQISDAQLANLAAYVQTLK